MCSIWYNNTCSVKEMTSCIADWCNGSTADSDSVSRGSSPLSVVKNLRKQILNFLFRRRTQVHTYRSVAQLGRALRSGRRGRVFESRHSDFTPILWGFLFFVEVEKSGNSGDIR